MLHQRKGRGSMNDNGSTDGGGGGGLSLSMGDDGDAYRSSGYGGGSSSRGVGVNVGGGGGGYGYTGYPPPPSMQPKQHSARSFNSNARHAASDKYRKSTVNVQSVLRSYLMYILLGGALLVTIIFSKVRYSSLNSKYIELEKTSRSKTGGGSKTDTERIRQLEKDLRESRRAKSVAESEQRKVQRELDKVKKNLEDHEKSHHHESSLSEDQLALLDPENQKMLKEKETEFQKAYDTLASYIQEESRREVESWLGRGPYKVKLTIELPEDRKLPTKAKRPVRAFVMELADLDTMPHSVHIFLEQVAAHLWDNTAFIINPGHVIQAAAVSGDGSVADKAKLEPFIRHRLRNVAFQEYNTTYPHERWTVGFAGRPGGPDFYINTQNNTVPHGPGGQKHHQLTNDADPCFGKVVEGMNVIKDIMKRPTKRSLFIKRITIKKAEIVAPVLQRDPHINDEEEEEEQEGEEEDKKGKKKQDEDAAKEKKEQRSESNENEPDAIPDYVNRDKGTEEEAEE